MRTIASLLFGRDAGELLDLITGEGGITGDGGITADGDREARPTGCCGRANGAAAPGAGIGGPRRRVAARGAPRDRHPQRPDITHRLPELTPYVRVGYVLLGMPEQTRDSSVG